MVVDADARLPLAPRRSRITTITHERGHVHVEDLAAQFEDGGVTVRGDLAALGRQAKVRRVRGGAVPIEYPLGPRPFEEMPDVGTTTAAVARALVARRGLRAAGSQVEVAR
ncbi:DeoR family transcriptional regulator [Actinophytocola sp.]|jgi:hypothetical protein|uniref:DeoR family transcriptional regulator n=1 Tax=Actinophytocola sp. TaxID=1872138 RepID=UPI002EDB453A